jgi:hypothetical protein
MLPFHPELKSGDGSAPPIRLFVRTVGIEQRQTPAIQEAKRPQSTVDWYLFQGRAILFFLATPRGSLQVVKTAGLVGFVHRGVEVDFTVRNMLRDRRIELVKGN